MHLKEIPLVGRNVLEFVCVPLYIDYLSDLHIRFQVASTDDINVEDQIWCFCYNFCFGVMLIKHKQTRTRT